jgi:hypothetical protein
MGILVSTYGDILSFLEKNMLKCPMKSITGMDCPGCGMQRSILLLMRGEVYESIKQYPATITILLMLVFLVLHLKFKFTNGATVLKYIFIFNAIIITLNFTIKQLH